MPKMVTGSVFEIASRIRLQKRAQAKGEFFQNLNYLQEKRLNLQGERIGLTINTPIQLQYQKLLCKAED